MNKSYRYQTEGRWFKGNTHIHSTASDGSQDFGQLAERYAGAGYDFLCRTDHWVNSRAAEDVAEYPLLWLDGTELDGHDRRGAYYHIVVLGQLDGIQRGLELEDALERARAQGGLIVLAHPHWTGNSVEDALALGVDGVEVYNNVCHWMNGKGESAELWDALLERRPGTLAFASDDAHLTRADPGWNGGWVMVRAAECSRDAILSALQAGEFYATTGPEFKGIEVRDGFLNVETSPVKFIRLVGPRSTCERFIAADGETLTRASFRLPEDWPTMYLHIEDHERRMAWTNNLFSSPAGGDGAVGMG